MEKLVSDFTDIWRSGDDSDDCVNGEECRCDLSGRGLW